jgi:hypothetical protein
VQQVAFVVYSGDGGSAARLAAELVPAFVAEGFGVVDVIRAHEGHWTRVPIRAGAEESPPVPFDDTHHPFVAQAVFDGRVTLASREEVRASLARSPGLEARWAAVMAQLPRERRDEAERVQELLARWVGGEEPDDEGAARVLRLVSRVEVRDAVVYAVTRDNARDHLRVWSALLRGAPDPQVPDTAAVTAFCAWLTGHGALAWCALDRCFEIDPDHRLGSCLAECLTRAVPPSVWEELDRGIRRSSPRRESA